MMRSQGGRWDFFFCKTDILIIYDLHSLLESNQKREKEKEASN